MWYIQLPGGKRERKSLLRQGTALVLPPTSICLRGQALCCGYCFRVFSSIKRDYMVQDETYTTSSQLRLYMLWPHAWHVSKKLFGNPNSARMTGRHIHVNCVFSHQLQIGTLLRLPPVQQEMDWKHFSFLHTANHWTTGNISRSLPS